MRTTCVTLNVILSEADVHVLEHTDEAMISLCTSHTAPCSPRARCPLQQLSSPSNTSKQSGRSNESSASMLRTRSTFKSPRAAVGSGTSPCAALATISSSDCAPTTLVSKSFLAERYRHQNSSSSTPSEYTSECESNFPPRLRSGLTKCCCKLVAGGSLHRPGGVA